MNDQKSKNRRAIVDIGSNSIRLVVFGGAPRAPIVLYNEKFSAGLGRGVITNGKLDDGDCERALAALARFAALVKLMDVQSLQVVATAAVRDASNGKAFLKQVKMLGLPAKILSGDEEAIASGYGVIAAMPDADGIVIDLGGGSMELVRISNGKVHDVISLPLGILRIADITAKGPDKLRKYFQKLSADIPWLWAANNLPLYLVGGSWRALARVHITATKDPLPVIGNHLIPCKHVAMLQEKISKMDKDDLKAIPSMPSARIPFMQDAAHMLSALQEVISPSKMIVCAFGLREGLLFQKLDAAQQAEDPLLSGARFASGQSERFAGYGEALEKWLECMLPGETPTMKRLRHTACLLADLGWSSNPEFRALSGEELALHGNWVGVTAADRAVLATALYTSFGGHIDDLDALAPLMKSHVFERAQIWGLAIRLAHRLGGGTARGLEQCPVHIEKDALVLHIPKSLIALNNGAFRGRFTRLANALKLSHNVKMGAI